ncbi:O-antigen ligase family protein [Roseitranquillus sediminis]|uniref:O-antigen ligase family protein n=1 Tax=Roseitranquillus sediminis TaxID=2809051 RepID=UPI001D0BF512|nr:O-antigen ligase family protein [Roseitranquillus sediminis]MBM9594034.1 O-antigen ligase family protein [Roseitranquillus sediminis]
MAETGARFDGPYARAQAILGWMTLALVLVSVIPYGANLAIVWTALATAATGLFMLQLVLHVLRPSAVALNRAVLPGLLWLGVLAWGWVQVELPVPQALAHPAWAAAPEGATPRIGADPDSGRHILMRLASYAMIAWILVASALESSRAWAYVRAVAIFSSALAVYGLWAGLTGQNPILGLDGGRTAVSATFVNRNSYATYAAFGMLANLAAYIHLAGWSRSRGGRMALRDFLESFFDGAWIHVLGTLLCAAAVVLSASRAGGVSAVLGLIALLAVLGGGRRAGNLTLWLVLAAIGGFVVFVLGSDLLDRLIAPGGEQLRFVVYPAIVEQILQRPWLGQGIGAFQDAFRPHLPEAAARFEWDMAHNSYLENLFELGIPAGAVFYLVFVWIAARLLVGLRVRGSDRALPALALAVLVTGGVHAVFDFSLQMPASAALFAAILGIGWAQAFPRAGRAAQVPEG